MYSTLTPQIKARKPQGYISQSYNPDHRTISRYRSVIKAISWFSPVIKAISWCSPDHRAISYYHSWYIFRADSPGMRLGLIALTTQISNIYWSSCIIGSIFKRPSEVWLWDLNSLLNMWQWDEKFNVKYDLANSKMNLLVHTRVPLTYGNIFCQLFKSHNQNSEGLYKKN